MKKSSVLSAFILILLVGAAAFVFLKSQDKPDSFDPKPIANSLTEDTHQTNSQTLNIAPPQSSRTKISDEAADLRTLFHEKIPGVDLKHLTKTQFGYRGSPIIDGREIFAQKIEFRKDAAGEWELLPSSLGRVTETPKEFPKYDSTLFEQFVRDYFQNNDQCELNQIQNTKEYWYLRADKLEPVAVLEIMATCKNPRSRRMETWIYSINSKKRIKILKKN